jgi:hypothetical protein
MVTPVVFSFLGQKESCKLPRIARKIKMLSHQGFAAQLVDFAKSQMVLSQTLITQRLGKASFCRRNFLPRSRLRGDVEQFLW